MGREQSTALAAVVSRAQCLSGQVEHERLGAVTVKDFCRYAVAVGDDGYATTARSDEAAGRVVLAPPLFLTGVLGWADGPSETVLRPDGLAARESPCTEGLPVSQVHGGADVRITARPAAGTVIHAHHELADVVHKHGGRGELVILLIRTRFADEEGSELVRYDESIVVREPQTGTTGDAAPPPGGDYGEPVLTWTPSRVRLFRFSAVSWNSHRVHYDIEHARAEGFPDVLVQSTLHGEMLARAALVTSMSRRIRAVRWRNLAPAFAGRSLRYFVRRDDSGCPQVTAIDPDGRPCASATVILSPEEQ